MNVYPTNNINFLFHFISEVQCFFEPATSRIKKIFENFHPFECFFVSDTGVDDASEVATLLEKSRESEVIRRGKSLLTKAFPDRKRVEIPFSWPS